MKELPIFYWHCYISNTTKIIEAHLKGEVQLPTECGFQLLLEENSGVQY